MNRIVHYLLPILAATVGWWAGQSAPASVSGRTAPERAAQNVAQSNPKISSALQSMLSQMPQLRGRPGNDNEIEWVKWCLQIPDTDVPQVIAKLDPWRDVHALRILYSRWAKLDFPTAWASFLKAPIPANDLHFYFRGSSSSEGLGDARLSESPKDLIAMRMLTSLKTANPARAQGLIDAFLQDATAVGQSGLHSYNFKQLKQGKDDGPDDGVVDYAAMLKEATGSKVSQKFSDWIIKDASAAMDWFRQLSPEKQATFNYKNFTGQFSVMKGSDIMALLMASEGKAMQDTTKIQQAAAGTSSSYDQDRHYGRSTPTIEAANAMRKWAQADPKAALAYVQQLPTNDFQSMLLGQLAGQLAGTDSAQAIALINQHPGDQMLGMKGLVSGWAEHQPTECWEWLNKISDPETLDSCVGSAVKQWSKTEPELAVKALSKVKDQAKIKSALATVVQTLQWNPAELQRLKALAPNLPWKQAKGGGE